jgi:cyclopropane fatty-acyl-phospholipid synthase-like methyltransferase
MAHDAVAVREKQLQVWDASDDPRWVLTVYEPLYGGKIFANLGGPALLDYAGAYANLGPQHRVLELGSGMGDACAYVASHFGCRVTGVEMSALQIERARHRHADSRSRGFDFVQADMLQWEPSQRYDAVYFGDMLAVAHDRRALLERIHRWLRPGGALIMTDILAGPDITDEDRAFIWTEDGFDVPPQADSLAMILDMGFQDLDVTDITHTALTLQDTILRESYRHKTTLVDAVGADRWLAWVQAARGYRRLFAEQKLVGQRIGTRRAQGKREANSSYAGADCRPARRPRSSCPGQRKSASFALSGVTVSLTPSTWLPGRLVSTQHWMWQPPSHRAPAGCPP